MNRGQSVELEMDALQASGFIQKLRCGTAVESGLYQSSCDFDLAHFEPGLFAAANIRRPTGIARAVNKRQAEYLAGRYLAARNLETLLPVNTEIPQVGIGEHREPVWPRGYIGSISHGDGHAVCVLAHTDYCGYIGIDLETYLSPVVCQEVASTVLVGDEIESLIAAGMSAENALTLIFSAKESLFKALYPAVKEHFGFECARVIAVDIEAGNLVLALQAGFARKHQLPGSLVCRFTLLSQRVETIVVG